MSDVVIRKVQTDSELTRIAALRHVVFVMGQDVPAERVDLATDLPNHYYLAFVGDRAVGTVSWRFYKDAVAKIEFLAVLDDVRGLGVGKKLMTYVIDEIKKHPAIRTITLGGQDRVSAFYEALGFQAVGEGYMDGGTIPHHEMILRI